MGTCADDDDWLTMMPDDARRMLDEQGWRPVGAVEENDLENDLDPQQDDVLDPMMPMV